MILSEFIYGGMDGVITTVAIIAGILGADISPKYALVLGLASLLADGFSMGISRYNSLIDLSKAKVTPFMSGLATFVSFVLIGGIPLMPFVFLSFYDETWIKQAMVWSSVIALLLIGIVKGMHTKKYLKSISEIMVIGLVGVTISYQTAKYVKSNLIHGI
jgi:hypothetical protein